MQTYEAQTLINLDQVADEINALFQVLPSTDHSIKETEERFSTYNKKADMIVKDSTSLCADAADVGFEVQAGALDDGIRKVQTALLDGQTQLGELKSRAGMFGSASSFKGTDIKPPTFSGDGEATADYFTFHKDYYEFAESRQYTKSQLLHTLKKTCLTGTARLACSEMDTADEIFRYLKRTYGNPNLLLIQKVKEFKKLGVCPNPADKRRDWLIKTQQQLKYLIKISTEHNILPELHHSEVLGVIHTSMPYKAQTSFRELVEQMDWDSMSRQEVFDETVNFLDQQVSKASSDLKLNYLLGIETVEKNKTVPKPAAKKTFLTTARADSDSPSECESEPEQPTAAAPTPLMAAAVSEIYAPPKSVKCKLCSKPHEYLFYCEKYQKSMVNNRYQMTRTTKACVRCLRMDSDMDPADRWNWWLSHEKNCLTDWTCVAEDCKGKKPSYQFHFTMCKRHIKVNKTRGEDFLKALDKNLLRADSRFFFNWNMTFSNQTLSLPAPPDEEETGYTTKPPPKAPAIFLIQYVVTPAGKDLMVFFDSGCSNACISDNASSTLEVQVVREGPTVMGVAGGGSVSIPGGEELFYLDTTNHSEKASIVATHMPEVTTPFPVWELQKAYEQIVNFNANLESPSVDLPLVPEKVGGHSVDIMIGIQYNSYFPNVVITLPCGLALYRSTLRAPGDIQGVLGGPHESWAQATASAQLLSPRTFFSSELRALRSQSEVLFPPFGNFQHLERDEDFFCQYEHETEEERRLEEEERRKEEVELGGFPCADGHSSDTNCLFTTEHGGARYGPTPEKDIEKFSVSCPEPVISDLCDFQPKECKKSHCSTHSSDKDWMAPNHWNVDNYFTNPRAEVSSFDGLEDIGSTVEYRCLRCRNCHACRNGEHLEKTSLEEELDQAHLETCVRFNPETGLMEARLPFKQDPVGALPNNRFQAEKMLQSQLRALARKPSSKEDVFRAHNKLRDKGHVVAINDLPADIRLIVLNSEGVYYIPWSVVYKVGSISSPSRIVFNASMKTKSGHSLNSILARGMNKLPRILHLLNTFSLQRYAFSADISMAYNAVKLLPEFMTFQRYLWAEGLDINDPIVEMVVVTLIYGVTPSGGLMTAGFESTADYAERMYPEHADGAETIRKHSYVDDILRSCDTIDNCHRLARSITFILQLAGMETKGFTFSGSDPPATVSADGETIGILGYVWRPKLDLMSLAPKELCLGKSSRGKAASPVVGDLKTALAGVFTRRVLSGKVCGIYDPRGLVTPITARIKLCLSEIVDLKLGWDDKIPSKYLDVWVNNILDIQELHKIRFPRCFVHPEAINDKIELLVSVDASMDTAVAAVHARSELGDGSFACRLICAKSRLVHLSTVPRGELRAAVMGAALAHVVKQNIGLSFSNVMFVTDSTIVLSWLNQDQRPLHTLVRNAVIEIRRLSDVKNWFHIDSANNLADLGTRKCDLEEIGPESAWQNGHPWMRLPRDKMPVRSIADIMLSQAEKREASREIKAQDVAVFLLTNLRSKAGERYAYSNYVVDPCAHTWPMSVRIMALVQRFVKLCSKPRIERKNSEKLAPEIFSDGSDDAPAPTISGTGSDGSLPPPQVSEMGDTINPAAFMSLLRPDAIVFTPAPESVLYESMFVYSESADCQNNNLLIPPPADFDSSPNESESRLNNDGPGQKLDSSAHTAVVGPGSPRFTWHSNPTAVPGPEPPRFSWLSTSPPSEAGKLGNRFSGTARTDAQAAQGSSTCEVAVPRREKTCIQLTPVEIKTAENYFFRKATQEVKFFANKRDYVNATEEIDGILYYKGRILDGQEIDDVENVMGDLNPLTFVRPVTDRYSPVSYSIMSHVHTRLVNHRNAATTLLESRGIVFIIHGRDLSNEIRESCTYCRRFKAKLLEVELGNLHQSRLRVASAFFTVQVDMFGPYTARCEHQPHRSSIPVWGVLFKCPASGAISACAMSKYDTEAFVLAYGRHSYRYGHPVHLYVDQGSQILKACREMELSWADITYTLNAEYGVGVEYTVAPVLGHNQIGIVERSVREVKKIFDLTFTGIRLDSLAYETAFLFIANELNNLPIALGSRYKDLDHTDLITPSRLILGRNNKRAATGYPRVDPQRGYSKTKSKQIEDLDRVHKSWWKVWQKEKLSDYIPRPNKWLKTTRVPAVDDVVVYLERDKDATLGRTLWRLGRVMEVKTSKDSGVRVATLGYKNAGEETWRTTIRPVRKMAIVYREGDLETVDELNAAARDATAAMYARINSDWRCSAAFCTDLCIDKERHKKEVDVWEEE